MPFPENREEIPLELISKRFDSQMTKCDKAEFLDSAPIMNSLRPRGKISGIH